MHTLLLWLAPFAAVIIGGWGLIAFMRRRTSKADASAQEQLTPAEQARVAELLKSRAGLNSKFTRAGQGRVAELLEDPGRPEALALSAGFVRLNSILREKPHQSLRYELVPLGVQCSPSPNSCSAPSKDV
jgi:hypothetical protein